MTESLSYTSGVSSLAREAIRLDVRSIPEVTFDFYRDSVLPQRRVVNTKTINKVKVLLTQSGLIANGRWCAFATDPAKQERHEDIVFKSLFDINNNILEAAGLNTTRCTFMQNPHEAFTSTRTNMTPPDGYRLCRSKNVETTKAKGGGEDARVAWEDVVEVEEYKKRNSLEDVRDVSSDNTPRQTGA
jgi:hypothetical protein